MLREAAEAEAGAAEAGPVALPLEGLWCRPRQLRKPATRSGPWNKS